MYLELEAITGPVSPPGNLAVLPTGVTHQNDPVEMLLGRLNVDDIEQRYWVSVTLPIDKYIDFNIPADFTVTFPNNANTGAEPVFDAIRVVVP